MLPAGTIRDIEVIEVPAPQRVELPEIRAQPVVENLADVVWTV